MGWIRETPKHRCDYPRAKNEYLGRVWECNTCGTPWKLKWDFFTGYYWSRQPPVNSMVRRLEE